ncbi:hypothetical protein KCTC52924_02775 [Arenibacter antarcticus]|uniref:BNR repeat-like domain-containing protein n=1 Tax=Arenibacter antarcticus TaxID=2040469 RepID=A0ABW5VIB8_9FLAO|nr:hypothetical protein [Arenibacter sp. H213]MCM4167195.1 hypothetical protein [Arenibacter sp. H213]
MCCTKLTTFLALIILSASCNFGDKKIKQPTAEKKELVHYITSPAGTESSLPSLFTDKDKAILSWVDKVNDSMARLNYSHLIDGVWQQPKEIIQGADWFVNWADFPMITESNGNLLSHILKKSTKGTYSYDIKMNVLPKGELQWSRDLPLHTDGTESEHGFVTAMPYRESSFFITWLDGRNTGGAGHGNEHGGAMSLRAAEVAPDGTVSHEVMLDDRSCDCCQTTAAITNNGPVVLYRDRSDDEIRDISITRMVNGEWTSPESIYDDGWKIKGCPVNGPKADVMGNVLGVTWFTAANNEPKVKIAFSSDGGAHFDAPILISDQGPLGRVDIVMVDTDNAIVSWMEATKNDARLLAMKVTKSGKISAPIVVDSLGASRRSGFPQMGLVKNKVHFAWTDVTDEVTRIKTAYIMLESF